MVAKTLNLEVMDFKSGTWYVFPWGQMVKSGELLEELESPEGQLLVSSRVRELAKERRLFRDTLIHDHTLGYMLHLDSTFTHESRWYRSKWHKTEREAWGKALIWLGEREGK